MKKKGRWIIVNEEKMKCGYGEEIEEIVKRDWLYNMEEKIMRVKGWGKNYKNEKEWEYLKGKERVGREIV